VGIDRHFRSYNFARIPGVDDDVLISQFSLLQHEDTTDVAIHLGRADNVRWCQESSEYQVVIISFWRQRDKWDSRAEELMLQLAADQELLLQRL
jgi:hypothetical protein